MHVEQSSVLTGKRVRTQKRNTETTTSGGSVGCRERERGDGKEKGR